MIICQPIGASGEPESATMIALDPHGAAVHQDVIISSDGIAARQTVGDDKSPARWMVVGIIDEHEPGKRI